MANQKAFLAAIRENPEDDTPRLIFADWLDENGDADRADFIRVGCELARLPGDDVRAFDLRWRHDELLARHGHAWREEVPAWARENCTFRRGFVNSVRANILKFIRNGKGLSRTVPVREVSLSAAPDRVAELAGCPHLAQLSSLAFYYVHRTATGITDTGAAALAASEHLSGLERLGLPNCRISNKGAGALASSKSLSALIGLDLGGNRVSGAGAAALLERLPRLVSLRVTNEPSTQRLDGEGLRRLFSSAGMNRLERLTVDTKGIDDAAVAALVASRPANLRHLKFEHGRFEGKNAAALARWPGLANLEELVFYFADLDSAGIKSLADSGHLSRLRRLEFTSAGIDDEGLTALARSPYLAGLTTLRLWSNANSERGVQSLVASSHLARLIDLDLDFSRVTAAVVGELAAAPSLAGLRSLNLTRNHFKNEGIERFTRALRMEHLAILELGYNSISDDGVEMLADCPGLSNLRVLNLECNKIGDRGAGALARSPVLARLQHLNLRSNSIGEPGMLALAESPSLADVISLNLSQNHGWGFKVRTALKKRFGDRVLI